MSIVLLYYFGRISNCDWISIMSSNHYDDARKISGYQNVMLDSWPSYHALPLFLFLQAGNFLRGIKYWISLKEYMKNSYSLNSISTDRYVSFWFNLSLQFRKSLKVYYICLIILCVWKVIVYQKKTKVQKTTTQQGEHIKKKLFLKEIFYPFDIHRIIMHRKLLKLDEKGTWMLKNFKQSLW